MNQGQPIIPGTIPSTIPMILPMGLELLIPTHQIVIKQEVELDEVLTGIDSNNRYQILDSLGRRLFYATESSDDCSLLCLGNCRPWTISCFNNMGMPVIQGSRESGCYGGCCNTVEVIDPTGQTIGGVRQNCELISTSWNITDGNGGPVLRLDAPVCSVCFPKKCTCGHAEFPLTTMQGGQILGKITKYYGGYVQERLTEADTFGVEFPVDLDVRVKAALIYATFMIDFMYYENAYANHRNRHPHHHHHRYSY